MKVIPPPSVSSRRLQLTVAFSSPERKEIKEQAQVFKAQHGPEFSQTANLGLQNYAQV